MARLAVIAGPRKIVSEQPISELGRKLRKIARRISASGQQRLTRREIEREIAERRGGGR